MIRINGICLGLKENEEDLALKVIKKYNLKNVSGVKIAKKSIDARKKNDLHFVYAVDLRADDEDNLAAKYKEIQKTEYKPYIFPKGTPTAKPVVIAGFGPGGMLCALTLAQNGYKVIVLERGKNVEDRKKDVDLFWKKGTLNPMSNVQFGEGGAGTFSDGKLTTGIKDFRIRKVLEEFHAHGAPKEILYLSKPHIGTDNLYNMVRSIREDIIKMGGEVRFSSRLTGIKTEDDRVTAAIVNDSEEIETDNIVLAIGHSARDTFEMLKDLGANMQQKSFSIGARIEHKQDMINRAQYGAAADKLPAADYKLSCHLDNGRGVYTFCMCPGGSVIASASEEGGIVTNGMSVFKRDGENANSALLVSVSPKDYGSDDPLAGMYFQRDIERKAYKAAGNTYKAPAQRVGDFLRKRREGSNPSFSEAINPTYRPDVVWTDLDEVLPKYITDSMREALLIFDKKIKGFAQRGAILTAPETRSSSPVRIVRDKKSMMSNIIGLYPCGEGAGYAGGITSAAVDGIKIAEAVADNNK